jgi:ubiquinone/menaquinone biosynthesis C-methylase UbiE
LSSTSSTFTDTFDVQEWSAIYENPILDSRQFAFRRAVELAFAECLKRTKPEDTWVDVGCGPGYLCALLSERGVKITGIDHDVKMLAAAEKLHTGLTFLKGSAENLPFETESVDGVVATSVMGCFASPDPFLQDAARVLRKNGTMILTCTNRMSSLLKFSVMLKPKSNESFHSYTAAEVKNDLMRNRFEPVETLFYNFYLNPGKNMIPPVAGALFFEKMGRWSISRFFARNFMIVASRI